MIRITQFTEEPQNLCELLNTFCKVSFKMEVTWFYTEDSNLNIVISINDDTLEGVLCGWLSGYGFHFEDATDHEVIFSGEHQYGITLTNEEDESYNWSLPELHVLLTGLLKTNGGALRIAIAGDRSGLRAAVMVVVNNHREPLEFLFAFGDNYQIGKAKILSWFEFREAAHGNLLTLPFTGEKGTALVCGFGERRQAIEKKNVGNGDIIIGEIFNDVLHRRLTLTSENLKSSTAIFGSPGYGKSTLVNSLLYQAWKQGVNFIVIEPAKEEYRSLNNIIPNLFVLNNMQDFNPLLPPHGMDDYLYAEVVLQLIDLATETPKESPLRDYFRETYLRCLSKKKLSPSSVITTYEELMKEKEFTIRANDFIVSGKNRLHTFFTFFCGPDYMTKKLIPLSLSRLLTKSPEGKMTPIIIELNSIPTPHMKTAFMFWILSYLKAFFQHRKSDEITHLLVLEEAHNILGTNLHPALITDVTNIVAENRAKGQTTFIIEQSPSRIDQGATDLCANIFSFRLTSESDRKYAASQFGVSNQSLNSLRKYCCLVRTNSMYSSEYIHVEVCPEVQRHT